jgi:hypothetical protein
MFLKKFPLVGLLDLMVSMDYLLKNDGLSSSKISTIWQMNSTMVN